MTPEQGSDEEMQRMLALKRHEQPPPAFFRGFSEKVMEGIQTAGPAPKLTLRQWLSVEFYGVPIYICAAGLVVCGLLVAGLIGSLRVGPAEESSDGNHPPVNTLVPPTHKPTLSAEVTPAGPDSGGSQTETGMQPVRATLTKPATAPK